MTAILCLAKPRAVIRSQSCLFRPLLYELECWYFFEPPGVTVSGISAGQMPSNSQSVFKYHRNASLTFLGGKQEQFGESGDGDTACGRRHKVQAQGWEPQSGPENIEVELKCLKLSASWWFLSFACWGDNPKFVLVGKVCGSGKSEFWRSQHRGGNAGWFSCAPLWSQPLRLGGF